MQIIKTSVIENIKHNFEELFPAEKKTAQYILDHLEEVTLLNISQLAKKAHSSEASIVRMEILRLRKKSLLIMKWMKR